MEGGDHTVRILYYNLQLGSFDGSNAHATGMLTALRHIHGDSNVVVANQYEQKAYDHAASSLKSHLGRSLDIPRMLRKRAYSKTAARDICSRVRASGFKPDVLLARSTLYDSAPLEIAHGLGCVLLTEANTPLEYECCDLRRVSLRPLAHSFEHSLYEGSEGIYAVSATLKKMLVESCRVPDSKICVIPNGYSADLYSNFADREAVRHLVRHEQGVEDAFVVSFVGSLQTWHGIERLIKIADQVRLAGGKRIVFWVLGDGAKRELVRGRSEGSDDFKWFGNVKPERMRDLLYASDLGVMPYECLDKFYFSPLKMFDMIGAGLPYIGLKIGQIAEESPSPIKNRCLLETTDPVEYAKRIIELRDGRDLPVLRDAMATIRKSCSWDARARDLSEWMAGLVAVR